MAHQEVITAWGRAQTVTELAPGHHLLHYGQSWRNSARRRTPEKDRRHPGPQFPFIAGMVGRRL